MSMSQVMWEGVAPTTQDPYEIGWYIESADEDVYGPVSRKTLRRFLAEGVISPNTLVRHCTQPEAMPAADQTFMKEPHAQADGGDADDLFDAEHDSGAAGDARGLVVGDRLAEAWPRRGRDQEALAGDSLPCAWHKRPATLVCVRCHAPYCNKCRTKPFGKQYFLCKRCQNGLHSRRFGALILDNLVLIYLPTLLVSFALGALSNSLDPKISLLLYGLFNVVVLSLIFFRDSLFGGSGIGKRASGLRVVQAKDGSSPLTFGQGILRWLSQFIPIFNLVDALAPYRDPLCRRYGDRWAGTRVIDTEKRLQKDRAKIATRLFKKRGVQLPGQFGMTMEELARLS
ncbi:MAG: RDD family protein [Isosphaeraceae bacterium]